MTIDEAIKQVTLWAQHPPGVVFSGELPAIKLLIEAGKRVKDSQENGRNLDYQLLPGETKD